MTSTRLSLQGAITEQQQFLDGATALTVEAEAAAQTGWSLTLLVRVPFGGGALAEGDLTLVTPAGDDLYAVVTGGHWPDVDEAAGETAWQAAVAATISGGSGPLDGAAGGVVLAVARASEADDLLLDLTLTLTAGVLPAD